VPSFRPGPDPDFPYLEENQYFPFPYPSTWNNDIIAVGGNLSPGMLLSAYEQGIFPWYNKEDPVIWQSPDPRCVIFPNTLHISGSMRKILKNNVFEIYFDRDFESVIRNCSMVERPGQAGTWISDDIIAAYTELHRLGWAHSAETWQDGELAGGCYGVVIGKGFFGESMFHKKPNASKAAFLSFAAFLFEKGIKFIDCQVPTRHLESFGGEKTPRLEFLALLKEHKVTRFYNGVL
jgi:leucyl/phenylalanyl-tRNA--protein transferase